jgi:hypothetical protein
VFGEGIAAYTAGSGLKCYFTKSCHVMFAFSICLRAAV